jgi:hypothetical protein
LLAGHSRSFNDESFDSRGNKGRVNDLEQGNPFILLGDCGPGMFVQAVTQVTRKGEPDHAGASG